MLAELLNIPRTPRDWSALSFANYLDHQQISAAILAQKNVSITGQIIDPIPFDDIGDWLARHQQLHTAIDNLLMVQSFDLQSVNLFDARQAEAWVWQHWSEHQAWHAALHV